jgi:zinc protease
MHNGKHGGVSLKIDRPSFWLITLMATMTTFTLTVDSKAPDESHAQSFMTRDVQKHVLPNGFTVITKEMHDKPVVATMIWYRVGSRNEELGQTGKSHFLEHMLFKGTDRYKRGDIDLITLKNGGANNAFTWLDFTAYYFTFASDRWQAALEIESNRMRHTTFEKQEFDPEKKVVEEELHIGLDGPWEPLENEIYATAFRQHPYHWPTVGWIEDLERASAGEMKAYYDKWYHPRNATLVIVGDFETNQIMARINQLFGGIPTGPDFKPHQIVEPPQKGEKRVVVRKATPVERMEIAYHTPAVADPDSYCLQVVEALLSTGKTSRLYKRLVDHDQSVTLAKASFEDHIDPGLFTIQAELKPGYKLADVEQVVYQEVQRLATEPVPSSELEKAKRQIEAGLVLANEEPLQQAALLGQYETIASGDRVPADSRGYKYLDTLFDRLRAVKAEDVARVVKKYFTADNRTVGYLVDDGTRAGGGSVPTVGGSDASEGHVSGRTANALGALGEKLSARVSFRTGRNKTVSAVTPETSAVVNEPKASRSSPETSKDSEPATRDDLHKSWARPDVERVALPNGLVLLLSENHSIPAVSIKAIVGAGSRLEKDDQAGLASLTGDLLDEGTTTRNSDQIAESVENVGGKLRTFGEYQSSGVQGAFLSKDVSLGLNITADLLMKASFPDDKVKQGIDRRVAQIKSRLDVPSVQASDIFNEVIFKGHPEHRPSVGYEETVKKLTRQDILGFYHAYYLPNNTILAIVGDIDKTDVKKKVEEAFGGWHSAPDFHSPQVPLPAPQANATEKFVNAQKEQVNIYIGQVGIDRKNPDYYKLLVFDTVLGSSPGFTSRIPRILRDEQGLAYSTFSNIAGSARLDPGRFVAYIGTSPENLDRALSGMRREIVRIVSEPASAAEVEGAKAYLTGSFVFDFQTNSQIATFLVDAETYGLGFDYLEKYPGMINAVTVDDVLGVARKYLDPGRMATVVVGPVDEHGKLIKKDGRPD